MKKLRPNYPKAIKQILIGVLLVGIGVLSWIYILPEQVDENNIQIRSYGFTNDMYLGVTTIFGITAIGLVSFFFGIRNIFIKY